MQTSRGFIHFALVTLAAVGFATGCATSPNSLASLKLGQQIGEHNPPACKQIASEKSDSDPIQALELFSKFFEARCYIDALKVGTWIRANYREKEYSITAEVFSVFVPEEAATEYVLESFERAYLSLLLAHAYLAIGRREAAEVEIRRAQHEGTALIYNYGDDPVNAALLGSLLENIGARDAARPFWLKLSERLPTGEPMRIFAQERVRTIDNQNGAEPRKWRAFALGRFPKLDWSIRLLRSDSGFYEVKQTTNVFPSSCASKTGAVISTQSWLKKIGARYQSDYHPLLHAKSWIRFPIGLAYGVTTFAGGLGLAVGGCAADGAADANGKICQVAIQSGGYLMASSADVVAFALKPDLRHWQNVPAGILITQSETLTNEPCYNQLDGVSRGIAIEL